MLNKKSIIILVSIFFLFYFSEHVTGKPQGNTLTFQPVTIVDFDSNAIKWAKKSIKLEFRIEFRIYFII